MQFEAHRNLINSLLFNYQLDLIQFHSGCRPHTTLRYFLFRRMLTVRKTLKKCLCVDSFAAWLSESCITVDQIISKTRYLISLLDRIEDIKIIENVFI